MKIAACAIAKNEAHHVQQWLNHTDECDIRVVVDTGSSDHTVSLLQAAGVRVFQKVWTPFRFDEPRNWALSHLPTDVDWVISPDFDEYFAPGWRSELEKILGSHPQATQIRYPVLIHEGDGKKSRTFPGGNLGWKIYNRNYVWTEPLHEVLAYQETNEKIIESKSIILHHIQDPKIDRTQNYLQIAIEHLKTDPNNCNLLWFALEGMTKTSRHAETIEYAVRYLQSTQPYTNFRSYALLQMVRSHWALHDKKDPSTVLLLLRAVGENPHHEEVWLELGVFAFEMKDWPLAVFAFSRIKNLEPKFHEMLEQSFKALADGAK